MSDCGNEKELDFVWNLARIGCCCCVVSLPLSVYKWDIKQSESAYKESYTEIMTKEIASHHLDGMLIKWCL